MTILRKLWFLCFGTILRQLMVGVVVVYLVMMALFIVHLLDNQRTMILERQTEQAVALSETLAVSAAGWIAANDISGLQEIVNAQRNHHELVFAMLVDKRGLILAHTDPAKVGAYLLDLPAEARQSTLNCSLALVDVVSPAMLGGRQVGWARVGVGQKIAEVKRAALVKDGLLYTLVAVLIGVLLAWVMGRFFTRRLSAVQRTIDAVRAGDRSARSQLTGGDEVAEIACEFDRMLDALQENDAALHSLHRRNELILNAVGDGIYGVDVDGLIVFANPAADRMLGYQPGEMVFKNSHQLFHHSRADGTPYPYNQCPMQKSLHGGGIVRSQEEIFWTKDGRMFPVEHVNTPVVEEGKVVGAVVLFRDIGARKAEEERLRLAKLVIESSSTVIFRWQVAAGWPVEYVSDNISLYGYAAADLVSGAVPFATLVHPGDLLRVNEELQRNVATGMDSFSQEFRLVTASGDIRVVEVRSTIERDDVGRGTYHQGIVIDITEHRRLEAQLRQSQKMEAIGTLAGGIAHDFNNILTAIIGFGEVVMAKLPPDSQVSQEQAHVLKAGERAKDLVKQILTFSRSSEQQLQTLLIQFIVKEALKLIRASLPSTIVIREEIDVNLRPVQADPVQIHQVIMNLCTNAYHAMRETGGVLKVSLKGTLLTGIAAADLGSLSPGGYALLEVCDSGCGMSLAVKERIFEPYFTTKAQGDGTGLGLSMVHGIIKSLGGAISVFSEPGLGATFRVYLPLVENTSLAEPSAQCEAVPGGDESVLVVDDEEVIVSLEEEFLQGLGYRVTGFTDSEKALLAYREAPESFDLLITDMTMPKLTGADLATEILRLRPGMPIVICTGHSELIDPEKAKAMGIKAYLPKPITRVGLAKAVRVALDESSPVLPQAGHDLK